MIDVSATRREVEVCEVTFQADVAVEAFGKGAAILSNGHVYVAIFSFVFRLVLFHNYHM